MTSAPLPEPPYRPPWPVTAAALAALVGLALRDGNWPIPAALGAALAAVYLFPWRLPKRFFPKTIARAPIFGLVILAGSEGMPWLRPSGLVDLPIVQSFAHLCAAELVVQSWCTVPVMGRRGQGLLLLTTLVFLCAATTFEHRGIALVIPAYLLGVLLALRGMRERGVAAEGGVVGGAGAGAVSGVFPGTAGMAGAGSARVAFALVLLLGFAVSEAIWTYRGRVGWWISRLDLWMMGRRALPGFTTQPVLGPTRLAERSMLRALRTDADLPDGHLRGLAFDTYTQGAWGPTPESRQFHTAAAEELGAAGGPGAAGATGGATGRVVEVTRLLAGTNWVFAPLDAASVDLSGSQEPPALMETGAGAALQALDPAPYVYHLVPGSGALIGGRGGAAAALGAGPLSRAPDAEERARCLALPPELDPRVRALAAGIAATAAPAVDKLFGVLRYLRSHHAYSLTATPGAGDPVSDFLLEKRSAHCEYFASAAVILLRCLGLPARYVSGYFAHEATDAGGLVVRQQDAHAWAETWIDAPGGEAGGAGAAGGVGGGGGGGGCWVTVEVTPPDGMPTVTGERPDRWRRTAERVADALAAAWVWIKNLDWTRWGPVVGGAIILFYVLLRAVVRLRRRRAERRREFAYAGSDARWSELAGAFEAWLARRGIACPASRTWGEHLGDLLARAVAPAPAAGAGAGAGAPAGGLGAAELRAALAFARAYSAVRFGRPDDGAERERLRSLLEGLA
ncbi:MAG: transglutaminase domain-containing protein [Planctomycetes bacterium]|nr:transglutaminase domain-containing protein [Planctomycetota bacterium]